MRPATSPFGTRIDSLTCPTNSNTVQNGSFFSHQTQFSSPAGFPPLSSAWPPWFLDICVVSHIGLAAVVGQFHDATRKTLNHQGHKVSRRLWFQALPSCTFVALVFNGFAN